ncbi:MAG TPA: polymer-forming cytoskeletal protein [Allosphingosinicella sp.]|jgi:cytoskeletal protein CcmA (bactofilin family)
MASSANPPPGDEGPSVIGSGISVEGDIEADVDLAIRGRIAGNVRCAALEVGAQGEIRGDVVADRVRVSGRVEGAIETGDLALEAGAQVNGDVTYSRIRMVKGAVVQGRMRHVERAEAFESEPLPATEVPPARNPPSAAGKAQKSVYIE